MFLQRTGENSFLVRTNHTNKNISLLFELCVVFKKKGKLAANEKDTGELCCGWCKIPIFQPTGTLLEMRTYEQGLKGGTPFDDNVPIDPSEATPNTPQKKTLFKDLVKFVNKIQGPVLSVKVSTLSRAELQQSSLLPHTMITSFKTVPLLCLYREVQLDSLVKRVEPHPLYAGVGAGPHVLALFPRILDVLDYIELLIALWDAKEKARSSNPLGEFRDAQKLKVLEDRKKQFCETVEYMWPFMHLFEAVHVPHQLLFTEQAVQDRFAAAQKFLTQSPQVNLMQNQNEFVYKPLNVMEFAYTPLSTDYTKYAFT